MSRRVPRIKQPSFSSPFECVYLKTMCMVATVAFVGKDTAFLPFVRTNVLGCKKEPRVQ